MHPTRGLKQCQTRRLQEGNTGVRGLNGVQRAAIIGTDETDEASEADSRASPVGSSPRALVEASILPVSDGDL
jgi:hypothetical protein